MTQSKVETRPSCAYCISGRHRECDTGAIDPVTLEPKVCWCWANDHKPQETR